MRHSNHSRQTPWTEEELANLGITARAPGDAGSANQRRTRKVRRSTYPPIFLTGAFLIAAGLGAGALIFPDRLTDLMHEQEWMKPSAAWSFVFPDRSAPKPLTLTKAEVARPVEVVLPPTQGAPGQPSLTPAVMNAAVGYPATTSSVSSAKMPRELPWLPEAEKSADAAKAAALMSLKAVAAPEAPAVPTSKVAAVAPEIAPAAVPKVAVAPPEIAPVPVSSAPPAAAALTSKDVAERIERARGRIELGDIAGARLLLQHAAAGREPTALMALAETYDPAMLSKWGARGMKGDTAKARELYQAAAESGLAEARTRVLAVR